LYNLQRGTINRVRFQGIAAWTDPLLARTGTQFGLRAMFDLGLRCAAGPSDVAQQSMLAARSLFPKYVYLRSLRGREDKAKLL
jgi:hypothetical protein